MSYEIIYGKQFIKLTEQKLIPVLYWGSNNCYEYKNGGRGRRERDFSSPSFLRNDKLYNTPAGIIEATEVLKNKLIESNKNYLEQYPDWNQYKDENFGYFASLQIGASTHTTTFKSLVNLVKDGIKKALTVEQILQAGADVHIYHYEYNEGDFKKKYGIDPINSYPKTSEELLNIIENSILNFAPDLQPSIRIDAGDCTVKRLKEINGNGPRQKRQKQRKEVPFFYVLKCTKVSGYFVKQTKYGYRYSQWDNSAKPFETEKAAQKYISKMKDQSIVQPVKIDRPNALMV